MSAEQPAIEAASPSRWRWAHFFAGLGTSVVVGASLGGFQPARPLGPVAAVLVLAGLATWWVRSGRLRTQGSAFIWGLTVGWPLLVVAGLALFVLVMGLATT